MKTMSQRHKISKKSNLAMSADEFIAQEKGTGGWNPPQHIVPELDKLIRHNRDNPDCRLGATKVAAWLERNGVVTSKHAVYRYLKKRSKVVK